MAPLVLPKPREIERSSTVERETVWWWWVPYIYLLRVPILTASIGLIALPAFGPFFRPESPGCSI